VREHSVYPVALVGRYLYPVSDFEVPSRWVEIKCQDAIEGYGVAVGALGVWLALSVRWIQEIPNIAEVHEERLNSHVAKSGVEQGQEQPKSEHVTQHLNFVVDISGCIPQVFISAGRSRVYNKACAPIAICAPVHSGGINQRRIFLEAEPCLQAAKACHASTLWLTSTF